MKNLVFFIFFLYNLEASQINKWTLYSLFPNTYQILLNQIEADKSSKADEFIFDTYFSVPESAEKLARFSISTKSLIQGINFINKFKLNLGCSFQNCGGSKMIDEAMYMDEIHEIGLYVEKNFLDKSTLYNLKTLFFHHAVLGVQLTELQKESLKGLQSRLDIKIQGSYGFTLPHELRLMNLLDCMSLTFSLASHSSRIHQSIDGLEPYFYPVIRLDYFAPSPVTRIRMEYTLNSISRSYHEKLQCCGDDLGTFIQQYSCHCNPHPALNEEYSKLLVNFERGAVFGPLSMIPEYSTDNLLIVRGFFRHIMLIRSHLMMHRMRKLTTPMTIGIDGKIIKILSRGINFLSSIGNLMIKTGVLDAKIVDQLICVLNCLIIDASFLGIGKQVERFSKRVTVPSRLSFIVSFVGLFPIKFDFRDEQILDYLLFEMISLYNVATVKDFSRLWPIVIIKLENITLSSTIEKFAQNHLLIVSQFSMILLTLQAYNIPIISFNSIVERWEFLSLLAKKLPLYKKLIHEHVELEINALQPACGRRIMAGFNMLSIISENESPD